jgi:hypothetical protein
MHCVIAPRLAAEEVAKGGLDTLQLLLMEAGAQLLEPQQLPSTLQQQQQILEASGEGEGQMVSQQVTQPPVTAARVPQGPPRRQESGRKRGRAHSAAAAAAAEPLPPPVLVLVSGAPAAAPPAAPTPGKGSRKAGGGAGAARSGAAGTSSRSPMARRGSGGIGRHDSSELAGEQQDGVHGPASAASVEEDEAWCRRVLPAGFRCYSRDWLVRSLLLQRCDWGDAAVVVSGL